MGVVVGAHSFLNAVMMAVMNPPTPPISMSPGDGFVHVNVAAKIKMPKDI